MKKKLLLLSLLLAGGTLGWSQQDQEAMEVTYTLTSTTSYNVSEDAKVGMSLYNKIRLMPLITEDNFSEIIYMDGSVEKTILHSFPIGLPEDWLVKPTKTEITKDSAFVSVGDVIYSRFALQSQELVSAQEAGPYYLATPLWKLPLTDEEKNGLEAEGAYIKINDGISLEYVIDESTYYYNTELLIEETSVNDGARDIEKHTTVYRRDSVGHIVLDFEVNRTLEYDSSLGDYLETVYTSNYDKIVRNFLDPTLEPDIEYEEEVINSCISASQLGGTPEVKVTFQETCPEGDFMIRILDMQGNVKMENIQVSEANPLFFAENLQFGIHIIEVLNQTVPSCTFMYIP